MSYQPSWPESAKEVDDLWLQAGPRLIDSFCRPCPFDSTKLALPLRPNRHAPDLSTGLKRARNLRFVHFNIVRSD